MPLLGLEEPKELDESDREAIAATVRRANIILALSAVSIVIACWISGAIATYQAYQAQKDALAGNLDGAEDGLRTAKIWLALSYLPLAIGLVVLVVDRLFR